MRGCAEAMRSMMLCVSEDGDSARSRRDQPGSVSDPPVGQLEWSQRRPPPL